MSKEKLYGFKNGLKTPILDLGIGRELLEKLEREVDVMSITPRTFESRTYTLDEYWYQDQYRNQENIEVVAYGIDRTRIEVAPVAIDTGEILGEKVHIADLSSQTSRSSGATTPKYTAIVQRHHSLEMKLIRLGIDHILDKGNKHCSALISIFERDGDAIKVEDGYVKTHTIVLYKEPGAGLEKPHIVVIDPSNFSFSSHLRELNKIEQFQDVKLITFHGKSAYIYKPEGETGNQAGQYRNCTDIAVKIALGLQYRLEKGGALSLGLKEIDKLTDKDLAKIDIFRELSNNPRVDSDILEEKCSVRIKQSSEVSVVETFVKAENRLKELLNMLEKTSPDEHSCAVENLSKILGNLNFSTDYTPEYRDVFSSLNGYYLGVIGSVKSEWSILLENFIDTE